MLFQILVITEAIVPTLQEIILATVPTLDTKEITVKRVWQIIIVIRVFPSLFYHVNLAKSTLSLQ